MIGISIKSTIGIGDALQYSSLPENYFKATAQKLYDVSRPWFFDHNPFISREEGIIPSRITEMWNFSPHQYDWPMPHKDKPAVYLSNAEIWAFVFNVQCVLNRPRLYMHEDFPYHQRKMILFQTSGRSHGEMPEHIMEHIIRKYAATGALTHIGPGKDYGFPHLMTKSLWDLAEVISKAKMFIGLDSGPSWIAACYPDVIVKKVRTKPNPPELFKDWVPLEIRNIHSHWDSREHMVYNVSENDIGFTWSYKRI